MTNNIITSPDLLATHAKTVLASQQPVTLTRRPVIYSDALGIRHVAPEPEPTPVRQWGSYTFTDVADFAAWVGRYKRPGTTMWATAGQIVAVINDHDNDDPAWGDWRGTLELQCTPAWMRWSALDRTLVAQDAFADTIEMGLAEIVAPSASDLLELVREFRATADTKFMSAQQDANGSAEFAYVDEVQGGSRSGRIAVPGSIELFVPVFEGLSPLAFSARFRWRLDRQSRKVAFGLVFPRASSEYVRDAMQAAANHVLAATGVPVWAGTAPAERMS